LPYHAEIEDVSASRQSRNSGLFNLAEVGTVFMREPISKELIGVLERIMMYYNSEAKDILS